MRKTQSDPLIPGGWGNNEAYIVALNSAQYGSGYPGPQCFKTLTITANGVTVGYGKDGEELTAAACRSWTSARRAHTATSTSPLA